MSEPYTLDELERRENAPDRFAYPNVEEYELGFYIWRQIRRDGRLNDDEAAVRLEGLIEMAGACG